MFLMNDYRYEKLDSLPNEPGDYYAFSSFFLDEKEKNAELELKESKLHMFVRVYEIEIKDLKTLGYFIQTYNKQYNLFEKVTMVQVSDQWIHTQIPFDIFEDFMSEMKTQLKKLKPNMEQSLSYARIPEFLLPTLQ